MKTLDSFETKQVSGGLTDAQVATLVGTAAQGLAVFVYQGFLHAMKKDQPNSFTSTYIGMPLVGLAALGLGYEGGNRVVERRREKN